MTENTRRSGRAIKYIYLATRPHGHRDRILLCLMASSQHGNSAEFRVRAKRILLTYSQVESNFDHHELVRLIGRLGARGCICRELHRNGGVHYHALLVFDSAYHTGTRIALMSEELTPISNQYDGLLEEHTNTCRRMVTSSSTISRTTILTGLEHLHQLIGLTSSLHQTKQLF